MELTDEMKEAMRIINETKDNVYITGKAGTGKTTLLRHLVNNCKKSYVIAAPTGVAAINAGGVTLHSLFNIPFGPYLPDSPITPVFNHNKQKLFDVLDMLIIDEISMVRPDVMDFINERLQQYKNSTLPFGGVQVVMFGDLYQLPPIVKADERKLLQNYYNGFYFYCSKALTKAGFKMVELSKVFRQTEGSFVEALNHIREYTLTSSDSELLEELRDKDAAASFDNGATHICSLKADVNRINSKMLGTSTFTSTAIINGEFDPKNAPCDIELKLRVGARVMSLINKTSEKIYNGSTGIVKSIGDEGIVVDMDNAGSVLFTFNDWCSYSYTVKDGLINKVETGRCTQYPLSLAWAITIHKSQGLTFNKVVVHSKRMFCSGQLYVALSRCRTLEGITTESFINKNSIFPDTAVSRFMKAVRASNYTYSADTVI